MRLPEFRIQTVFAFSLIAVTFIGLLNLYSAGIEQPGVFGRQTVATFVGGILCFLFAMTDYRVVRRYSLLLYAAGNVLVLGAALIGHEVKATRAWLQIGMISIQPSEWMKPLFVLYLSAYLGRVQKDRHATLTSGLLVPAVLLAIPVGLILLQGDAGTAAIFIPVFFAILYLANLHFTLISVLILVGSIAVGTTILRVYALTSAPRLEAFFRDGLTVPYVLTALALAVVLLIVSTFLHMRSRRFRMTGPIRMVAVGLLILLVGIAGGDRFYRVLKPHQKTRIASFFKPKIDPRGAGYQSLQAQIAVGSGGIFGKGYLKGTQKRLGFLPEQWTDFAFSVLAEEWGFFGSVFTLLLYATLIGSALWIGRRSTDLYGSLLAGGGAALYFMHMSVGVAMNLGAFPVVGIPMPFLSYGGSAQIANLAMGGLILSVARHRRLLAG